MSKAIYTDKELLRIQEKELEALKTLVEFCEKEKIEYFIIGGTALGAVRHGGFIPWDDDIDVGMTRDNYLKFIEKARRDFPKNYSLQVPQNEKKTPYPYAKLRVNGTKFVEYENHRVRINHGVYIDIFPFDEVPDEEEENKKHFIQCRRLIKMYVCRQSPRLSEKRGLTDYLRAIKKKIVFIGLHCIPLFFVVKKMDKCITRYNGKNTKAIACLFFPRRKVEYIEKKDLYPLRKIIFCGLEVNAPNNLTKYLTTHYGDYMSLPSEEERVSHRPYIVEI